MPRCWPIRQPLLTHRRTARRWRGQASASASSPVLPSASRQAGPVHWPSACAWRRGAAYRHPVGRRASLRYGGVRRRPHCCVPDPQRRWPSASRCRGRQRELHRSHRRRRSRDHSRSRPPICCPTRTRWKRWPSPGLVRRRRVPTRLGRRSPRGSVRPGRRRSHRRRPSIQRARDRSALPTGVVPDAPGGAESLCLSLSHSSRHPHSIRLELYEVMRRIDSMPRCVFAWWQRRGRHMSRVRILPLGIVTRISCRKKSGGTASLAVPPDPWCSPVAADTSGLLLRTGHPGTDATDIECS